MVCAVQAIPMRGGAWPPQRTGAGGRGGTWELPPRMGEKRERVGRPAGGASEWRLETARPRERKKKKWTGARGRKIEGLLGRVILQMH